MTTELLTDVAYLIAIALGAAAFAVAKWGHHAGPYLAITAIAFLLIGVFGMLTGCAGTSDREVSKEVGSLENAVRRSVRIRLPRWPVR